MLSTNTNIALITLLVTSTIHFVLGVIIWLQANKSQNKKYSLFIFLIGGWLLSHILRFHFQNTFLFDQSIGILMSKISLIISLYIFYTYILFIENFPNRTNYLSKKLKKGIHIILIGVALVTLFTNSILVDQSYDLGRFSPTYTWGLLYMYIYTPFLIILFFVVIYIFIHKLALAKGTARQQLLVLFRGILITGLLTIGFSIIFPTFNFNLPPSIGSASTIIISISTTYAILKHQLFEIKTILSQVLFVLMGILLFSYVWVGETLVEFIGTMVVTVVFTFLAWGVEKQIKEELAQNEVVEKSNKKIQEAIEAKDIFLRMTSHQLRTPLTSLNGFIEMILDGAQTTFGMNDAAKRDLVTVHLNVQRLSMVVNDILAVNALNANRFSVTMREEMDMREMVESLIKEKRYFFDYYDASVNYSTEGTGDFVAFIDPVRIRDAVSNVFNNAVFYGKGQVTVVLKDMEDGWVEISVTDNGIGLERKEEQQIWRQEYRNHSSEYLNPNGTGMGLYVAKQTLKRHHGKILVESAGPGKGTTVIIRLLKVQS